MLTKGSKGDKVCQAQEALKTLGYLSGSVDGDFGQKTAQAVADFQTAYFVDGIIDDVTEKTLARAIEAWSNTESNLIIPVPNGLAEIEAAFGKIVFDESEGGNVIIVNDWADENIVQAELPVVGRQLIHKKLEPVFQSVFQDLVDKGLDGKVLQFGCWVPRHKMHNPSRGLSTHSWAIAVDINWATNGVGKIGDIDPGIVASFEAHGFEWGGRWRYRDDMHFQLAKGY